MRGRVHGGSVGLRLALSAALSLIAGCLCPQGSVLCAGACVDVQSDVASCGGCGVTCEASQVCAGGVCTCAPGSSVCTTGCADLAIDRESCGACGRACPADATCMGGVCRCPAGLSVCGLECRDLTTVANCGGCAVRCSIGAACVEGSCECPGVEPASCSSRCVDFASDDDHCGRCATPCATGARCSDGRCLCAGTETICDDACVSLDTSEQHCGRCGSACPSGATCEGGACVCRAPELLCDGACVDVTNTLAHCGGCDRRCSAGELCADSRCRPTFLDGRVVPSAHDSGFGERDGAVAVGDAGVTTWAHSIHSGNVTVTSYAAGDIVRWTRSFTTRSMGVGSVCSEAGTGRVAVSFAGSSEGVRLTVFDDLGGTLWTRTLDGDGRMRAGGCAFAPDGQIVFGGVYGGTVDFGGTSHTGDTYGDGFLATYRVTDGSLVHVRLIASGTTEAPVYVTIAPDGDRLVTGATSGLAATIGVTSVTGPFVARIAADDTVRWVVPIAFERLSVEAIGRPAVDGAGNVYVPGTVDNTSTMPVTHTLAGLAYPMARNTAAAVVVSLDPTGAPRWVSGVVANSVGSLPHLAAGDDGTIYAVGSHSNGAAPHTFARTMLGAAHVVAYTASGALLWTRALDGAERDLGTDVAVSGGVLAVVGRTDRGLDLGGGLLTASGDDVWMARYAP